MIIHICSRMISEPEVEAGSQMVLVSQGKLSEFQDSNLVLEEKKR